MSPSPPTFPSEPQAPSPALYPSLPSGTHHPARTERCERLSEPHNPAALPGPRCAHAPRELAEGWDPSGPWEPQVGVRRGGLWEGLGFRLLFANHRKKLTGSAEAEKGPYTGCRWLSVTRTGTPPNDLFLSIYGVFPSPSSSLSYSISMTGTPSPLKVYSSPAHTTCGSSKPLCKYQTQIPKAHSAISPACVMDHPLSSLLHPRAGSDSIAWPLRPFSKLVGLLPPPPGKPLLTSLVLCVALSASQVQD